MPNKSLPTGTQLPSCRSPFYAPEEFIFNNTQLVGLPKTRAGFLPCPEEIIKTENDFVKYGWDVFYNIGMTIRKRLQGKYPKEFRTGNILFSFSFFLNPPQRSHTPGAFNLALEKDWVAEALDSPRKIEVSNHGNCPWMAFAEIMIRLQKL